jgi:hypothetical protein
MIGASFMRPSALSGLTKLLLLSLLDMVLQENAGIWRRLLSKSRVFSYCFDIALQCMAHPSVIGFLVRSSHGKYSEPQPHSGDLTLTRAPLIERLLPYLRHSPCQSAVLYRSMTGFGQGAYDFSARLYFIDILAAYQGEIVMIKVVLLVFPRYSNQINPNSSAACPAQASWFYSASHPLDRILPHITPTMT